MDIQARKAKRKPDAEKFDIAPKKKRPSIVVKREPGLDITAKKKKRPSVTVKREPGAKKRKVVIDLLENAEPSVIVAKKRRAKPADVSPIKLESLREFSDSSENSDSAVEAERQSSKAQRVREKKVIEKRKQKKKERVDVQLDEESSAPVMQAHANEKFATSELERMFAEGSIAAPIEQSMSRQQLEDIEKAIGSSIMSGALGTDQLEDCTPAETLFFRQSFAEQQQQYPPVPAKQRVRGISRNPYDFAYIADVIARAPKEIQSMQDISARQLYRNVVFANSRTHEEMYMCEPRGMEKKCCNGTDCAGLMVKTRDPFILKAFLFEKEHEKYVQHTVLPQEVEDGRRACILCMRHEVTTRLTFLRAHGTDHVQWNAAVALSRYRNFYDQPGEYRLEDCNVSTSKNGQVFMEPVVRFSRSDYDLHIQDGRRCYMQKLAYPDVENHAPLNDNVVFNNTRKVGV